MLDLWFSEFHAPDAKLSILVKEQLYSEQTPFQKIDFFDVRINCHRHITDHFMINKFVLFGNHNQPV